MLSDNPYAGIVESEETRTLDLNGGNPACNQGGTIICEKHLFENHSSDARYTGPLEGSPTLTQLLGTGGNNKPLVCECYGIQGSMIGRNDKNGPQGSGVNADEMFTLNTVDRHGVAYSCICGSFTGFGENEMTTLCSRDYKDPNIVFIPNSVTESQYIVRRLMPVECARLQGFPDDWGEIEEKQDFTDEEYEFWKDVRTTYGEINGKQVKAWTKDQMLKWYNKLHSDSAEYKMWGNGVSLPCVDYVMEGIAEEGSKTMGSLFDGSGGFPLAGLLNGIEPIWASEIEPYPIAVTVSRFG